jgi:hypothetical protein
VLSLAASEWPPCIAFAPIARPILTDPSVLVLDQAPFSARLYRLAEGRTTITIAHRLLIELRGVRSAGR